ncbi:MAG: hypothetical protein WDZ94_04125 [Patescibacteria group bacterium]
MSQTKKQKKTCSRGHVYFKSTDCPTCPLCEKEKPKEGIFADMASPVRGALEHAGITTLAQLSKYTEKEILNMHGIGPTSMPIFKKKLYNAELSFKK